MQHAIISAGRLIADMHRHVQLTAADNLPQQVTLETPFDYNVMPISTVVMLVYLMARTARRSWKAPSSTFDAAIQQEHESHHQAPSRIAGCLHPKIVALHTMQTSLRKDLHRTDPFAA
eukprot:TRINITY_DN10280_c0_g1_i4.p2 TRINITY_DN10280_c0_g1~~TRINITY_DN10280_c0_g1_i4.p2  ORF type:complete len:118 (-),score=13.79 TRINITY_DN10280_c0_g1_i4:204-557(-)